MVVIRGGTVEASGELDLSVAGDLSNAIRTASRQAESSHRVVVDLSAATFIDAAIIDALVAAKLEVEAAGLKFQLAGVSQRLLRTLEIARVAGVFGTPGV
jgi:anti-anti-sigma factor